MIHRVAVVLTLAALMGLLNGCGMTCSGKGGGTSDSGVCALGVRF